MPGYAQKTTPALKTSSHVRPGFTLERAYANPSATQSGEDREHLEPAPTFIGQGSTRVPTHSKSLSGLIEALPIVHEVLRSQGRPLDPSTRAFMEPRFGHDFSHVRVHTDRRAAESARTVNARAYTVGEHLFFGAGQFAPETPNGRRLLSHELAHVVQQAGGGASPGQAQEQDADAASRAVETGYPPRVRAPSGVGLAAQLEGPSTALEPMGDPLDRYRKAGVAFTTYEEITKEVIGIMNAPGPAKAAGRRDFNRDPARAKANLYHAHFHDNRERLSYACGVFEQVIGVGGEGVDRDVLFATLVSYESSRVRSSQLVVHKRPTEQEIPGLEKARRTQQLERAHQWETGARRARNLADVTQFATPAREHQDPLVTAQIEPRQSVRGSVQGYQLTRAGLEPRDLLPKPEFRSYATDWERAHSGSLVTRGLAPVVSSTPTGPWPKDLRVPAEYPLLGYIGYVTADNIYVPEVASGASNNPTQTLATALEKGLPAYAYTKIGKALEEQTGYGGAEYLVSTDTNGRLFQVWQVTVKSEPPIESVVSPIDFFGPKLVISGGRALAGAASATLGEALPAIREAVAPIARKGSLVLGLAMEGASDLPVLTLEETPAAFVLREEAGATASAQAREVATRASSRLTPDPRTTEDVFREIHQELGLETPGTIRYRSTAAAAAGAAAAGFHTPTRPGFQTHSTASSVRRVLGRSGRQWQSVHMVFQAAYRTLRARGYIRPGGQLYSPGRALTTLDVSLAGHRAFDAGWIPLWNAAVASGQRITTGQVYEWLSNAINAVDPNLISPAVQGAILDRVRTELFVELGLNWNDPIRP